MTDQPSENASELIGLGAIITELRALRRDVSRKRGKSLFFWAKKPRVACGTSIALSSIQKGSSDVFDWGCNDREKYVQQAEDEAIDDAKAKILDDIKEQWEGFECEDGCHKRPELAELTKDSLTFKVLAKDVDRNTKEEPLICVYSGSAELRGTVVVRCTKLA